DQDRWELYDTRQDWSQARDMSEQYPDKLAELQGKFLAEAARHQVLPLDDRTVGRYPDPASGPPHPMRGRSSLTVYPHMDGLVEKAAPNFFNRSFTLTATLDGYGGGAADGSGDGLLASIGGRFAGFAFYVLGGRPVFCYNFIGKDVTRI